MGSARQAKMIEQSGTASNTNGDQKLKKVLEELHLHQAELEMQNDELRSVNEKLELQQIKFSGIYDLAPIGYFISDKNGLISDVNLAGIGLLECGKGSIINNKLQSFVNPEYLDIFHVFFREMLNTKQKQKCNLKLISRKKKEIFVQVEGIAIIPRRDLPLQCDIVVSDITERVLAEQGLAQIKERLELALEASSSGTWELELDSLKFHLETFTSSTCLLPYPDFAGYYRDFLDLIHPDDRQNVDIRFRHAINHHEAIDLLCRIVGNSEVICIANIRGHIIQMADQPDRFVGILMDVTAKKQLEEEVASVKNNQQRKISLATIQAEENERARISNELHDSVSQLLYGIRLKLQNLTGTNDSPEVLKNIYALLDMAVKETRDISFKLAPAILNDFGLPATIEEMARRLSTSHLRIITDLTGLKRRMNLSLETNIFRILQELVNNAIKHSGASEIIIKITKGKKIEISVSDNGKGFDIKSEESSFGSGLSSIKNRLNLYNGTFELFSYPGQGSNVEIKLSHV